MSRPIQQVSRGITMVELLIAVAILAILAVIAGPNLLAGQTRAKVAHARSDMQMLIRAAEAYKLDYNGNYMLDNIPGKPDLQSWVCLTTPVAYVVAVPTSPFREFKNRYGTPPYTGSDANNGNFYEYWSGSFSGGRFVYDSGATATGIYWRAEANGPDSISDFHVQYSIGFSSFSVLDIQNRAPRFINCIYDPSNGTLSRGDMFFCNKGLIN